MFDTPHKKKSAGQPEEGLGVVNHVQYEHFQSYLLNHYQNAVQEGQGGIF